MTDARQRLESRRASLTSEQRALLEQRKRGLAVAEATPPATDAIRAADLASSAEPPVLSSAQERSWFLQRLHPGDTSYNLCQALRVRGPLDVGVLGRAFVELVERHDILRTRYLERGARVVPERLETLPTLELHDWGARSRSDEALAAFARERSAVPFRIEQEAPLRATLLVLGQEEHALVLVLHHIAVDGWSMGLIAREWVELYAELSRSGRAVQRRGLQYADVARWERDPRNRESRGRALAFWCDKLRGAPEVDLVPTDHPRPKAPSGGAGVHTFAVGSQLAEAIRSLAREEGTGPFSVLLSASSVLLARYSSQTDICVGTPVAARTRPELESVVGSFANTVVQRSDLRGDPTFRALVRQVRGDVLASLEHQGAPFDQVVAELAPLRDPSRTPLFQVFFAFEDGARSCAPPELEIRVLDVGTKSSAFDLAVFVRERRERLAVSVEYRTDLYDEQTVVAFGEHWLAVLESAVAAPDARLSQLRWCGPTQQQALVRTSDGGVRAYEDVCLHTLLERQAALAPDRVAILSEREGELTYGELVARASQLAARLRALGVGPEMPVAIFLARSLALPVAILAVLHAGGVCLPLEIDYPAERLHWMLSDARPAVVLTDTTLSAALPPLVAQRALHVLAIDAPAPDAPTATLGHLDPQHSAYLIYTSGTTGRPKGVLVPHRGIVNHLFWMRDTFALGPDSRGMQKAPFGFGAALFELFAPLSFGGSVVMVGQDAGQDAGHLLELVRERSVTLLEAVPSLLDTLLKSSAFSACRSLRHVLAAGEALTTELVRRFGASLPSARLHNLYGPTEASFTISGCSCGAASGRSIPIGRPIANVHSYVLNAELELVPRGAVGEICAGGRAVTHGYHGAPAATAEKFAPDPFGPPGSRLYRTGDLGRWLPDGTLECLGRSDHQVKIRGFRVELGEIEAALTAHDGVREAVVVPVGDEASRRLAAYYLPVGDPLVPQELRGHLRARLPDYMIPALFVPLDAFPLSPNGKVDRSKLPAPAFAAARERVAPRSDREREMAEIWRSVLGVDEVGALDDLFELGGNSMRLAEIVARVRARFDVELPLRRLFEDPTIAGAVRCVDEAAARRLPPLLSRSRRQALERLPVSFAQEEILRRPAAEPVRLSGRLRGPLSIEALRGALGDVVQRHEGLRTTYGRTGDAFWQRVHPEPLGPVLAQVASPFDLATPFDLTIDAPLRARVEPLAPDVHALTLVIHPVAVDAMGTQVLLRDLLHAYEARRTAGAALPPLQIQPADHALWQRAWVESPLGEALAREWRAELPRCEGARADRTEPRGEAMEHTLPAATSARLREFAQTHRFTLGMVVLTGFVLALAERTGHRDVSVLVPTSGRDLAELETIVARLVNPVIMRVRLDGARGFLDACGRVRERLLWAEARAALPFSVIGREPPPYAFDPGSHMADASAIGEHAGLRIEALPEPEPTPASDLELYADPSSPELRLRARFRPDAYGAAEVSALLETTSRTLAV